MIAHRHARRRTGESALEYREDVRRSLLVMARLTARRTAEAKLRDRRQARNRWTRTVDVVLSIARRWTPWLHWIAMAVAASLVAAYAWLVAATSRYLGAGGHAERPRFPPNAVLSIWHGCTPSLIPAIVARSDRGQVSVLIATDPRGDFLALLCRMLGIGVVRGDSEHRPWEALLTLAERLDRGDSVLVTADGWSRPLEAQSGPLILSAATGRPLVSLGSDCRPALTQHYKWDRPRNPLPFGRVATAVGESRRWPRFAEAQALEEARSRLQESLNRAAGTARQALTKKG